MDECIFKTDTIELSDTIFDSIIDRTYVILCCGEVPERIESVKKNINILRPTKYVDLIYFMGYKDCEKSLNTANDLLNNNIYVIKDAIKNNYNRILVLEDDFFLRKPLENKDINNITEFIKENNPDVYTLGCFGIPTISTIMYKHQKLLNNVMCTSHCNIYSKDLFYKYIDFIDSIPKDKILNVATDIIFSRINDIKGYRYHEPLVFQVFPETENQQNWHLSSSNKFSVPITYNIYKILNLDKKEYPGYQILYKLPIVLYILLFLIIILVIYCYFKLYKLIR